MAWWYTPKKGPPGCSASCSSRSPSSKRSKRLPITLWHLQSLCCHLTLSIPSILWSSQWPAWVFGASVGSLKCAWMALLTPVTMLLEGASDKEEQLPWGLDLAVSECLAWKHPQVGRIFYGQTPPVPCSVKWAVRNHLEVNHNLPPTVALFAFENELGKHVPMTWSWFMDQCNEVWALSGKQSMTGHSFCIGGTMHLLLIGVDPFVIMVQGHWKSLAFLKYWRNCKEIIPTMIGLSLDTCSLILTSMSSFKCCLLAHSWRVRGGSWGVSKMWLIFWFPEK